jgi:hypothetical protein
MSKLPPSLIEQAIYIVKELDIDKDELNPSEYGKLVSNLAMLRMNAFLHKTTDTWEDLINHLMYPEFKPYPKDMFALPKEENRHYKLALQAIDEIYNKYSKDEA